MSQHGPPPGPVAVDVQAVLRQARSQLRQATALAVTPAVIAFAAAAYWGLNQPYWLPFEGALVVALFAALAALPPSRRILELREQFPNDKAVQQTSSPKAVVAALWGVVVVDLVPVLYAAATFEA